MHYFYILRSKKNGKLYIGQTNDIKERVKSHNSGKNLATKSHVPYELIFYSGFLADKDAIECEKYFKTTAGWKRLKIILKNTLETKVLEN